MKKFIAALCLSLFIFGIAHTEETYDHQHTVLALNMAVVSINRIIKTEDRAVLEWEYNNIIHGLAFGNIESNPEIIKLFQELANFINGKKLRQEDAKKLREFYEYRQKEAYYRAMHDLFEPKPDESDGSKTEESLSKLASLTPITQDVSLPLLSWVGNLSVSTVSSIGMSYYGYQAEVERIHSEFEGELWKLKREEIESCHQLQSKLLESSWPLLRKYRIPDEDRLTEDALEDFFKAMETSDPSNRLEMLEIREHNFKIYPPYWLYRAIAAFDMGDMNECDNCLSKFNEVWRPVLRTDYYKAEAAKYQASRIIQTSELTKETLDRIRALADTIRYYSPTKDWSNRIFAGLLYFGIGEREEAVKCIRGNTLFHYEDDVSNAVLEEMKKRPEDFTFDKISKTLRKNELEYRKSNFLASIKDSELSADLTQYFASCDIEAFAGFEYLMKGEFQESKQHFSKIDEYCDGLSIIGTMYAKGLEVEKDYKKSATYYEVAARLGHFQSQWELGNLYYDGGPNLERDYMKALKWYHVLGPGSAEIEYRNGSDYVLMPLLFGAYNIFTFGGTWVWFTDWIADSNIQSLAFQKVGAMYGWGWFYFEKGSKDERAKALEDAQAIIASIPERQKNWKQ